MKKILCLLSVSLLFLASCSSSSDSSSPDNPSSQNLLLKKIVEGDVLLGGNESNFTYNGNKLVENRHTADTDLFSDIYTYTGDVITKIEKFGVYNAGTPDETNDLLSTDEFQYNANNQLVQFKTTTPDSDVIMITTYTYNGNTVTFEQYKHYLTDAPVLLKSGTITVQNGEIVQLHMSTEFDTVNYNYTYDAKNSIFKNVVGYDKLLYATIIGKQGNLIMVDSIVGGSVHNFVNGEFQYTYNANNYPVTANQSMFGSVLHTFQFSYY
ncbi:hypothetical protein [Flavobacterium sp. XGLA_31]|uniref:hypothetical protein n=1 Tax=Flavobacterium sp. XGLA_31 TaxID=3447666 RepID=UPI003F2BE0BE